MDCPTTSRAATRAAAAESDALCFIDNIDEFGLELDVSVESRETDRLTNAVLSVKDEQPPTSVDEEHGQDRSRTAFCTIA
ncbi:hypothetical protein D9611_000639 [Ephemerocybe angulata]|uniref:Uncharacterized protein n=1 Tax=Ephemerocybe angulata TaxID=980116 RepID=A0A8H5BQB9_9AGAR|nr:hypothetical protein D9611_000639 [Tulosesus angulatus]